MNKSYKTIGIVIGKRDFGEADKILIIFTQDLGKIQVKAKGLKRALAKMAGHLEVFNLVRLELIKGKTFYIVIGAELIDGFTEIQQDFDKIGIYYYFCEVLDKILDEGIRHKNTFSFFLSVINKLNQKESNNLILTIFFELNILSYLGFRPEFLVCVGCREDIGGHKFFFSQERGGVLCESCGESDFFADLLTPNAVKLMRLILVRDLGLLERVKMESSIPGEVKKINGYFLEHILGRELKSKKFLAVG